MSGHVFVSPDVLVSAATRLEALAERLRATVDANVSALHVPPAGAEEVSVLTASHFNAAADGFLPAANVGIAELLEAAATLRRQAADYDGQDRSFGSALTAGM